MKIASTRPEGQHLAPEFFAELTPYRSLGRNGFILLMVIVATSCLLSGISFLVMGAWPVFMFMGLGILIVWGAFMLNYRAAKARETVSVNRHELRVQKFDPAGRRAEFVFNPFWTRFEIERHEQIGITRMRLKSREETISIGSFLNPADRESFAHAFNSALGRARA